MPEDGVVTINTTSLELPRRLAPRTRLQEDQRGIFRVSPRLFPRSANCAVNVIVAAWSHVPASMIKEVAAGPHVPVISSLTIVNVIARINRRGPTCPPAQHMQYPASLRTGVRRPDFRRRLVRSPEPRSLAVSASQRCRPEMEALWTTWK